MSQKFDNQSLRKIYNPQLLSPAPSYETLMKYNDMLTIDAFKNSKPTNTLVVDEFKNSKPTNTLVVDEFKNSKPSKLFIPRCDNEKCQYNKYIYHDKLFKNYNKAKAYVKKMNNLH